MSWSRVLDQIQKPQVLPFSLSAAQPPHTSSSTSCLSLWVLGPSLSSVIFRNNVTPSTDRSLLNQVDEEIGLTSVGFVGKRNTMSAAFSVTTIDTGHEDMIHDAQMDFLGTKLATCSCDKTIRLFDLNLNTGTQTFVTNLKAHEGPIWQLAWAHPRYGSLLASCSYDRRVIIWKENDGKWDIFYNYYGHDSSVNSVCWAPPEWGLMLACGSSDSAITVLSFENERWNTSKIPNAHALGCNAVSWAPSIASDTADGKHIKRIVSGGCDNLVKIWREVNDHWIEDVKLEGHSDWVRDVAWAPSAGVQCMKIASSSQDRRVIIWNNRDGDATWTPEPLHVFDDVVWHVSWNFIGDILAVSGGDNQVSLWKRHEPGGWECISDSAKSQGEQRTL